MTKKKTTKNKKTTKKKTPTLFTRGYVVASGDPFDGVSLFGPFEEYNDAAEWAERASCTDCWWIVDINDPN